MKEKGITYNNSISKFNETFEKIKDIKHKLELEIEKLNNSQNKTMIEITETYKRRHLLLNEEENQVKLNLDKKVSEIKIYLEKNLNQSNELILSYEKMNKANEYYKNNDSEIRNENNIRNLYYISEINKNIEKSKSFIIKPIMNSEISFNKFNCNISYFDYYFSGIPIPTNIRAEKKKEKLVISWNISNYLIKNIYPIYQIHIKTNKDETTFKTSNTNFPIDEYDSKAVYEIKIRAFIDNYFGEWSEIKTVIANEFDEEKKENKNIFDIKPLQHFSENIFIQQCIKPIEKKEKKKNIFNDDDNNPFISENNKNPFKNLIDNEFNIENFNNKNKNENIFLINKEKNEN